jgi:hypothetical protein
MQTSLLTPLLAAGCVILLLACIALVRRVSAVATSNARWYQECHELRCDLEAHREFSMQALGSIEDAVKTIFARLADDVERTVGHTDEAALLESLASDMWHCCWHYLQLSPETLRWFGQCNVTPPAQPGDMGQALKVAVQVADTARSIERRNHELTRLCCIHPPGRGKWLADVLSRYERLCGSPQAAQREFRMLLVAWKHEVFADHTADTFQAMLDADVAADNDASSVHPESMAIPVVDAT